METECPNCPAIWGHDEYIGQYCMSCGYPNHSNECSECIGECDCDYYDDDYEL